MNREKSRFAEILTERWTIMRLAACPHYKRSLTPWIPITTKVGLIHFIDAWNNVFFSSVHVLNQYNLEKIKQIWVFFIRLRLWVAVATHNLKRVKNELLKLAIKRSTRGTWLKPQRTMTNHRSRYMLFWRTRTFDGMISRYPFLNHHQPAQILRHDL